VQQEIARPTFAYREEPLSRVCGFVGFKRLMERVDGIRKLGLSTSLKPTEFLKTTAEYFLEPDDEA
jgi:hypothetical protein